MDLCFQIVQQYAKRIPVATDAIWLQLARSGGAQIKLETIAVETTAVPAIALATVRAMRRQPVYDSSVTHIAFVLLFLFVVWSKLKFKNHFKHYFLFKYLTQCLIVSNSSQRRKYLLF